ncbi:MAG: hypothetical protein HXY25_06190, partial [Alphaproteobacteria bacterium]|nr:hypothetical protein [Alphaproteobacteria bacterium]
MSDDRQIAFRFGFSPRHDRRSFVAGAANAAALTALDRWPEWSEPVLALHGPAGCGKTHLAAIWAARARAGPLDPARLDAALAAGAAGAGALLLDLGAGPLPG